MLTRIAREANSIVAGSPPSSHFDRNAPKNGPNEPKTKIGNSSEGGIATFIFGAKATKSHVTHVTPKAIAKYVRTCVGRSFIYRTTTHLGQCFGPERYRESKAFCATLIAST